jgi:hypothetical protein
MWEVLLEVGAREAQEISAVTSASSVVLIFLKKLIAHRTGAEDLCCEGFLATSKRRTWSYRQGDLRFAGG